MTRIQFAKIANDIERGLDKGEPPHLSLVLHSGIAYHGYVVEKFVEPATVVLSLDDTPPLYVDVRAIASVTLWSGP